MKTQMADEEQKQDVMTQFQNYFETNDIDAKILMKNMSPGRRDDL